jgi:hypothetical protein
MRPPVPWADIIVAQISNKLRTQLNQISGRNIRDAFNNSCDNGMEGILQFRGRFCPIRFSLRAKQTLL